MPEHSPEPWEFEQERAICAAGPCIRDANNHEVLFAACAECRGEVPIMEEEDARRIVACVNACKGLSTEAIENTAPFVPSLGKATKQPPLFDELLAACQAARDLLRHHHDGLEGKVYMQLYDVLEKVKADNTEQSPGITFVLKQ